MLMLVPEASMNEYCQIMLGEYDIRLSGQILGVQSEAESKDGEAAS